MEFNDLVLKEIHEDFYFNKNLNLPTIIKEYKNIENIFVELKYLACITIQVSSLRKIEYHYGSNSYNNLLALITDKLKAIKIKEFRNEDVLVVDLYDPDSFLLFLSAPREDKTQLLLHLDEISDRVRIGLDEEVFNLLYPYMKEYCRPTIGFGVEIYNPMVNHMRTIMKLVSNAKKMGEFRDIKRNYMSKYNLQKIIIEKNITTIFQPIVDLRNLEIFGYEALSRGPKETEFFNPLRLFIMASECGLSFELDGLCRKEALKKIKNLKIDKKIFVNTLSTTIHDPQFRGIYLKNLLQDLDIKPENVVFEISEKLAIENYDLFRDSLKDYTDIGIVHAGDDIGTGYSDLERIMELNPGYLKVDISFVRGIDKSYVKQEIIKAMVTLAKKIESEIIVEGIETAAEYEILKKLEVPYGQGFLFARPSDTFSDINRNFN
ncbi:MAG: EAL domain-containing protein [Desulfobacterales bacterium]|nr:EAL domain-containing protein [Desulfobacterales bacterium]